MKQILRTLCFFTLSFVMALRGLTPEEEMSSNELSISAIRDLTPELSDSHLDTLKSKITFLLEKSSLRQNHAFTLSELTDLIYQALNNADKLNKKGYVSFYHAKNPAWGFLSDIVRILEEKKLNKKFSNETLFFLPDPEKSNNYSSITDLYEKISASGGFSDLVQDFRAVAISSNIFITGYWFSSRQDENTFDFFIETPARARNTFRLEEAVISKELTKILERYAIPLEKKEMLIQLYKDIFRRKKRISSRLVQIAIANDQLDKLVKITSDYGREFPGMKTSAFIENIKNNGYSTANTKFKENLKKYFQGSYFSTENLNTLQARIFVDFDSFTDPTKVKTFDYYIGFDAAAQQEYERKLRNLLSN